MEIAEDRAILKGICCVTQHETKHESLSNIDKGMYALISQNG